MEISQSLKVYKKFDKLWNKVFWDNILFFKRFTCFRLKYGICLAHVTMLNVDIRYINVDM